MSLAEPRLSVHATHGSVPSPRVVTAVVWIGLALLIVVAFGFSVSAWTPGAVLAAPLVALTAIWISGGAATALLGQIVAPQAQGRPATTWRPTARTAVLFTVCNEDPGPIARHLKALRHGLDQNGMTSGLTEIFVLSDTSKPDAIAQEEACFRPLMAAGDMRYRRRADNIGRKPGNIASWFRNRGADFDYMLVLDADSRMTPDRIRQLIWQIGRRPDLGLLQAGIAVLPGNSRLGRHQRIAARLLSRGFGRGFAAWTGDSGNFWGHNAIMRTAAFRAASDLPVLPGRAPWGGSILSHDFIEAARIRRAGWAVALDPSPRGSAEAAPQTLADFHARDRRWCQGNLQHLRLIAAPRLDPVSRLHLAMGVLSYVVAPMWLALVLLTATGAVPVSGILPLVVVIAVLLLPKACALAEWWQVARTPGRRATVLRASMGELLTSSIIAPLVMLRQAKAVIAVCLGYDCGWKSGQQGGPGRFARYARICLDRGYAEAAMGCLLAALAIVGFGASALWLAPVALPLALAPVVTRAMDAPI